MLRLAVPDDQILRTPYHAWNDDFLNPENQLATMDFRGVLLSKDDCLQATIPQIKARWVRRARPMPMPRDTRVRSCAIRTSGTCRYRPSRLLSSHR